jgi:carbonic anhydrase
LDLAKREEISFDDARFTGDFAVKGTDPEQVKAFFTEEVIKYLTAQNRYHIEGNENGLMVFQNYRYASSTEVEELLEFTKGLVALVTKEPPTA